MNLFIKIYFVFVKYISNKICSANVKRVSTQDWFVDLVIDTMKAVTKHLVETFCSLIQKYAFIHIHKKRYTISHV